MSQSDFPTAAEARALAAFHAAGGDAPSLEGALRLLRSQNLQMIDTQRDLPTRWVDVRERPVPPEADTIIRTLTRSIGNQSWTATYWLDGLRAPAMPGPG